MAVANTLRELVLMGMSDHDRKQHFRDFAIKALWPDELLPTTPLGIVADWLQDHERHADYLCIRQLMQDD